MILSETPETYGAEHLLTRRAVSREVGEKLLRALRLVEGLHRDGTAARWTTTRPRATRPAGITTILEKSLGAVAKAGRPTSWTSYRYAEPMRAKGFVFMDTPGYDPVVRHRPGRGRREPRLLHDRPRLRLRLRARAVASSSPPTPRCIDRMNDDMDVNCGGIADGEETVEECGRRIFELILRVASGERTEERGARISARPSSRRGSSAR